MNYYELIYLQKELKNKLLDCWVELAMTPFKNQMELFIVGDKKSFRLVFNSSSGNQTLFEDSYRPPKKKNTISFFDEIYGDPITDVSLVEHDRVLKISFNSGHHLWFKLFANKANVLFSDNESILSSFKDYGEIGDPIPEGSQKLLFEIPSAYKDVKDLVIKLNPLFPRTHIQELSVSNKWEEKNANLINDELKLIVNQIVNNPVYRILASGKVTLISEEFLPQPTREIKNTVNELIQYRFKNYASLFRFNQKKKELSKSISRHIKRLQSVLNNLKKAEKGIQKATIYEKYGHLLMANAHIQSSSNNEITVNDFYSKGEEISISIDSTLSIVQNAEKYYQRSSNSKKSFEEAETRKPEIERRYNSLKKLNLELDEILVHRELMEWQKKNQALLDGLNISKNTSKDEKLPFHVLEVSNYQVWIGKNAKSNDKLVQMSHKEDIWMHARGVPGSHLIVRMNNNRNMPDSSVIDEAAAFAAYNSKAKGASLVPIIYTKRKFVRKPKGAAPGAVTIQKEQVTIVEPKSPEA